MKGYELHEMSEEMQASTPLPEGDPSVDTLWGFVRRREERNSGDMAARSAGEPVGNDPPNVSFAAATYGIVDDGREKAEAWLAANPTE